LSGAKSDAATVAADGELERTVIASRFRGDHHDQSVATALGRLRFRVDQPLTADESVRLRIDPNRVARLAPFKPPLI